MANTTPSPIMSMPIPVPGTDPGPQYAFDLDSCLLILDGHDHTPGLGNPITPGAMDINSDLSINAFNLLNIRSSRYSPQGAPLALAADLGCVYVSGVDLWYNDVSGNQIQITTMGGVAGTPGSIANLVPPASASYVAGSKTFVWQSNVSQAANLDAGSIILRNIPGTNGLTLSPPTLGSNYTITLPTLPSVSSFMSIDNSGTIGASIPLSAGITASNLASDSVITSKILDLNVTEPKLADNSVSARTIQPGAVTSASLGPLNIVNSAPCFGFVTSSTSDVAVTNLSVVITLSGTRPVCLSVQPNNSGDSGFGFIDAVNPPIGHISLYDGVSLLQENRIGSTVLGAQFYDVGNLIMIDTAPSAGSHTYSVKARVSSGTTNLNITNLRLIVYEM